MADRRCLTALTLRNARCFGEPAVTVPLHPRATVLLGENGTGKSTVVEALAALGDDDPETPHTPPRRRGAECGEVTLREGEAVVASWSWGASGGGRFERPGAPLLFAYGSYRRVLRDDVPLPTAFGPQRWVHRDHELWRAKVRDDLPSYLVRRRTETLRHPDPRVLHDLREALVYLWEERAVNVRAQEAWGRLNESLRAMEVGIDAVEVGVEDDRHVPRLICQGARLPFEALSDGYQSVLVLVFDLILRAVHLRPWYAGAARPVVVVDEIDLHLHPWWQRGVVRQLLALFPEVQFVFTTHSASVVQDAIDLDVGVVLLREEGGVSRASVLSADERHELAGAHVGSLLVDARLFGLRSRLSPSYEAMEEEVATLRQKVDAGTATEDERRRVVELLDVLLAVLAKEDERRAGSTMLSEVARLQVAFVKRLAAQGAGR